MSAMHFQAASLAGLAAILLLGGWMWLRRPHRRLLLIPPMSWAALATAYYGSLLLGMLRPGAAAVFLSAVLGLLEVLLVLGGVAVFIWRPKVEA